MISFLKRSLHFSLQFSELGDFSNVFYAWSKRQMKMTLTKAVDVARTFTSNKCCLWYPQCKTQLSSEQNSFVARNLSWFIVKSQLFNYRFWYWKNNKDKRTCRKDAPSSQWMLLTASWHQPVGCFILHSSETGSVHCLWSLWKFTFSSAVFYASVLHGCLFALALFRQLFLYLLFFFSSILLPLHISCPGTSSLCPGSLLPMVFWIFP